MATTEIYRQITEAIVVGLETSALDLTRQALSHGLDPMDIISHAFMPGLEIIGQECETGLCFMPEMVVAGRIMQNAMKFLEPPMKQRAAARPLTGKIVIGTAAGDIHTIGKDLVATVLHLNGFEVIDLGANVPAPEFIAQIKPEQPHLLGLSALTKPAAQAQQDVITALIEAGLRSQVKVIIGGVAASPEWAAHIGADGYGHNAVEAVNICRQLLAQPV
jgi:trimethylamine corrinoid protein